ncbi:hypothetical protein N2152v2_002975 [Parachlorella kessleri]
MATDVKNILSKPVGSPSLEADYTLGKVLGKGAFGVVRLVLEKRSGELFACKSISKAKLITKEDVEDVKREVEILHLLTGHPNIAGLKATYEDKHSVHLIIEYCKGGELFERIISKGTFSEAEAARYFRQMVEVVHHCHVSGVMHRDIKPENFLLTTEKDDAELEACDFGLSAYFRPGQRFTQLIGSAYYVAPEVLSHNYSYEADLWSLGVVLYILLSGIPPFWGDNESEIFGRIKAGYVDFETAPWPSISSEAKDLVLRMLTKDPAARTKTDQMLKHPWLVRHGVASEKPLPPLVITRMKKFAGLNRLKKAAIVTAAKYLSPDQIEGLRHMFESFDRNGDGSISLAELREGLLQMDSALTETELLQVMKDTDVDNSGAIDYGEFLAATINMSMLEREEVLMKTFHELDRDGSGFLSADEIAAAVGDMSSLSADDIKAMIQEHDVNGDGVIDYTEFITMLRENDSTLKRAATSLRTKGLR